MIENYRKLMYYAIMTVVLFSCVQQTVASDSSTEGILVNYTAKRYLFEQSTVREFFSGAYYDLFLVMRGSGVFRCSEVVLPAQQQNLIILKPGQGGRLEYAGPTARWRSSGCSCLPRCWRSCRMRTLTLKKASTWCPSGKWLSGRTARSICC
mgnify:CR=1 FL=1